VAVRENQRLEVPGQMRKVPAAERAGQAVPSPMYRTKTTPYQRKGPKAPASQVHYQTALEECGKGLLRTGCGDVIVKSLPANHRRAR
jgi:hypothetical protein